MLTRVVIFPCVFSSETEYQTIITMLKDCLRSGVILIDDKMQLLESIKMNISNTIPIEFQQKINMLLDELGKQRRFVKDNSINLFDGSCSNNTNANCIKLSLDYSRDCFEILIVQYFNCSDNSKINNKIVSIENYSISLLPEKLDINNLTIKDGEWTQDNFEKEILIPLFRYAKQIKLCDRNIGRYFKTNPNYKANLEWLFEVCRKAKNSSTKSFGATFEIYCGAGLKSNKHHEMISSINEFEVESRKKYPNFEIEIFIVDESQDKQFPHDRYLITDQFAISIGRGFDLFINKSKKYPRSIREVEISRCVKPDDIMSAINKLPKLERGNSHGL